MIPYLWLAPLNVIGFSSVVCICRKNIEKNSTTAKKYCVMKKFFPEVFSNFCFSGHHKRKHKTYHRTKFGCNLTNLAWLSRLLRKKNTWKMTYKDQSLVFDRIEPSRCFCIKTCWIKPLKYKLMSYNMTNTGYNLKNLALFSRFFGRIHID